MLKMLMFRKKIKDKKECIVAIYYKCELSLFGRVTQNKQKALFSLCSMKQNKFQKYKKKKKKKKKKKEIKRDVIRT